MEENRSEVRALVEELLPIADAHVTFFERTTRVGASPSAEATSTAATESRSTAAAKFTTVGSPEATSTAATESRATAAAKFTNVGSPANTRSENAGCKSNPCSENRSKETIILSGKPTDEERGEGREPGDKRNKELELNDCSSLEDVAGARKTESKGVDRVDRLLDSLCEYSLAISAAVPSKEMALAEFRWRNGWFLSKVNAPDSSSLNIVRFDCKIFWHRFLALNPQSWLETARTNSNSVSAWKLRLQGLRVGKNGFRGLEITVILVDQHLFRSAYVSVD